MKKPHAGYPSDVSDEEWAFAAPYLTLMSEQGFGAEGRIALAAFVRF